MDEAQEWVLALIPKRKRRTWVGGGVGGEFYYLFVADLRGMDTVFKSH